MKSTRGKDMKSYLKRIHRESKGFTLIELLVVIAILGTAVTAFIVALSAGSIAVREQEEQVVAQGLAQTQLEYVKSCSYDTEATTYPTVETPEGYAISVVVSSVPDTDADIQKITVTISSEAEDILAVENYKVNR